MKFIPITADLIPALYDMYAKIGHANDGYFEQCLAEHKAGNRLFYIGLDEAGYVMAYGVLNMKPGYSLYQRLNIPEIQDLNVTPSMRRQGIGTELIRFFEHAAMAQGFEQVGISVGLTKAFGAAQRLYTTLGYIPDGFGVTYDREPVTHGEMRPIDDNLCLMMVKNLT